VINGDSSASAGNNWRKSGASPRKVFFWLKLLMLTLVGVEGFAAHFMESYSECILSYNCPLSLCGRNSLARLGGRPKGLI
jgi:hypothetical protein